MICVLYICCIYASKKHVKLKIYENLNVRLKSNHKSVMYQIVSIRSAISFQGKNPLNVPLFFRYRRTSSVAIQEKVTHDCVFFVPFQCRLSFHATGELQGAQIETVKLLVLAVAMKFLPWPDIGVPGHTLRELREYFGYRPITQAWA